MCEKGDQDGDCGFCPEKLFESGLAAGCSLQYWLGGGCGGDWCCWNTELCDLAGGSQLLPRSCQHWRSFASVPSFLPLQVLCFEKSTRRQSVLRCALLDSPSVQYSVREGISGGTEAAAAGETTAPVQYVQDGIVEAVRAGA